MTRRIVSRLALVASLAVVPSLSSQAPAVSDSGIRATSAVMRVTLYRYADGMQQAAQQDMRTHLIPIWEAQKAAGLIVGYSTMTNTTASSKDDWQFGVTLTYRNWAAIDSLPIKNPAITLKHYGTAEARTAANQARARLRTQVSSNLITVTSYSRP
jgi:hypothetical protein